MAYSDTITIPQNSRGFFLRERDTMTAELGITIKFPRGRGNMHGDYQDMIVSGSGPSKIRAAMPKIRSILEHADQQYRDFCVRRDARKDRARNYQPKAQAPTNANSTKASPKKTINVFAALDGLFEQEEEQRKIDDAIFAAKQRQSEIIAQSKKRVDDAIANGTAPKPVLVKVAPMNFAAAIAKPKPKKVTFTTSKVRITVAAPKSQFAEIPPVEYFDWGDEDENGTWN
jgi:hypothetical protein